MDAYAAAWLTRNPAWHTRNPVAKLAVAVEHTQIYAERSRWMGHAHQQQPDILIIPARTPLANTAEQLVVTVNTHPEGGAKLGCRVSKILY